MDSASLPIIWNKDHVKVLLRHPIRLMKEQGWRQWIQQRGGLSAIYAYLQRQPLAVADRKLLQLLLEQPRDSASTYANLLKISRSVYFQRQDRLLSTLVDYLNAWDAIHPKPSLDSSLSIPITLSSSRIPTPLTSFVGREAELGELQGLLQRPEVRLLTLTGTGGIGKTRLAIQLVKLIEADFDTVGFISLASVVDPALALPTIAQQLGLHESGPAILESISTQLGHRRWLVVLDSVEQIASIAVHVTAFLEASAELTIITTSRHLLHVYGEYEYAVGPLPLPEPNSSHSLQHEMALPAVTLFVDRAVAVNPRFRLTTQNAPTIVRICQHLDGIPLAIELAAERHKWFSLQAIAEQIQNPLAFLVSEHHDRADRQRTIHDTLAWSYALLEPNEQALFARLGIFEGDFTLEAVVAVCLIEPETAASLHQTLIALVQKSMVRLIQSPPEQDAGWRFRLFGIFRDYALERLAALSTLAEMRARYERYLDQSASAFGK